jgi:RNA polymerase sigma-70 factor (ECF subfamily)
MRGVAAGDEAALADLYDRHADAAFRIAYRLLGDRGLAEEVLQETMLTLWDKADQFDARIASLSAWLMTIARNRAVDRLRARARRPILLHLDESAVPGERGSLTADAAIEAGQPVGMAPAPLQPEALLEADWVREAVRGALGSLRETERQALELAYYEELTQVEIAARLGWPLGTVKTRTRRALLRLRSVLAQTLGPDAGAMVVPVAPEEEA